MKAKQRAEDYSDNHWYTADNLKRGIKKVTDVLRVIKKEKLLRKAMYVLDLGCGNGKYDLEIEKTIGVNILGVDVSRNALKKAKEKGIQTKYVDVERKLPFKSGTFDAVLCFEVIEHVFDTDLLANEITRVLKKKGLLILTTPNLAVWHNRLLLLFGIQPYYLETSTVNKNIGMGFLDKLGAGSEPVGHLRLFTQGAIKDLLKANGFEIKKLVQLTDISVPKPRIIQFIDSLACRIPGLGPNTLVIARLAH